MTDPFQLALLMTSPSPLPCLSERFVSFSCRTLWECVSLCLKCLIVCVRESIVHRPFNSVLSCVRFTECSFVWFTSFRSSCNCYHSLLQVENFLWSHPETVLHKIHRRHLLTANSGVVQIVSEGMRWALEQAVAVATPVPIVYPSNTGVVLLPGCPCKHIWN